MSTKSIVDNVVALSDGCICCNLNGQFRESIAKIIHSDNAFDYAIIETSGVTDPTSVISALEEQFGKMYRARLDQVVCVIDATLLFMENSNNNDCYSSTTTTSTSTTTTSTNCSNHHHDEHNDCDEQQSLDRVTLNQLRSADLIVLNKIDLISEEQLVVALKRLAAINPLAKLRPTTFAEIPINELLDVVVAVNHGSSSGVLSHEAGIYLFIFLFIIIVIVIIIKIKRSSESEIHSVGNGRCIAKSAVVGSRAWRLSNNKRRRQQRQ